MAIYFASDHAGTTLRKALLSYLKEVGHEVVDLGPEEPCRLIIQILAPNLLLR